MFHPLAKTLGLILDEQHAGYSKCSLLLNPEKHHNPHRVAHGAVLYALADTGMGAALYPSLSNDELCATIEIKMNYFRAVREGTVVCLTELINRGKTIANLEARLYLAGQLVAQANGNFAIIPSKRNSPSRETPEPEWQFPRQL